MHFEFLQRGDDFVDVYFKSSKEEVYLGELKFYDPDGDKRDDIQRLLLALLKSENNPMWIVKKEE